MAKSKKNVCELEEQASSVMRFLFGEEVLCSIDWDERYYYVWMEPTSAFCDFCEECGDPSMILALENVRESLRRLGVNQFCDLDGVNQFLYNCCGDDEPAEFYEDEFGNICGA